MPAAPGSRNISLKAQPKHMKMVLKSAIIHVTGTTLFDTAFPPSDLQEFWEHYREALMKCAKYLDNKELFEHSSFDRDDDIVVASARVVRSYSIVNFESLIMRIYEEWHTPQMQKCDT